MVLVLLDFIVKASLESMRAYWHVINFNNNNSSLTQQQVLNTNYFSFFYHLHVNLFKNLPYYKKTLQVHNPKNSRSFFSRGRLLQARIALYNVKFLSFTQNSRNNTPKFTKYLSSLTHIPTLSISLHTLLQPFIVIKGSYFPQYNRELCVDTRWQLQHFTLKKKPMQQRYRKKLKSIRLKKTALISAAYNLYKTHNKNGLRRSVQRAPNLGSMLKLNWLDIVTGDKSINFLPNLRTNPVNVRLKNTYNWFKDKPYLFLNTRPERPTKEAFLTQSLLFKTFLRFKKTIRKGVLRQKPLRHKFKFKRSKRIFRLKNNLSLLKLTTHRNLTQAGQKTWGIGTKFKLLYNQNRLVFRNRSAVTYKTAYVYNTSDLNLTTTQNLTNMDQYFNSAVHNLTWWTRFSKHLFRKSLKVVKKYTGTRKLTSNFADLSRKRYFKFKTEESRTRRKSILRSTGALQMRFQRFIHTKRFNHLKRQLCKRSDLTIKPLTTTGRSSAIVNCLYDRRYNNCKQISYLLRQRSRYSRWSRSFRLTKHLHQQMSNHYTKLIMSRSLFLNHPGKLSAWVLRFLMNTKLLTSDSTHQGTVRTLKYYSRRTRRSHSTLRKTVFRLTKHLIKPWAKTSNPYRVKHYSLKTRYNSVWVFKQSRKRLQLAGGRLLGTMLLKIVSNDVSSVSKYYPTLNTNNFSTAFKAQAVRKVSPSVKLHLVSLYNIAFILKPYAFIYTNTPNLNNPRSLVHNTFPLFKYRRYVHSFLYQNEVKRYILKRHRMSRPHFGTELTTDFFDNIRTFKDYVYRYRRVHLTNLAVASPQQYFHTPDDRSVYTPMHDTLKIKRVRFKPGYYRLWRNARTALKESLNLSFRYQHRLTSYLPRFYKLSKFQTLHAIETKLTSILIYTNLIPDYEFSKYFIDNNLVYVNGIIANQYNEVIVLHDFIQLVVSLKFYIADRWLTNWKLKKQLRLKKLANAKYNNQSFRLDKQSSNKLPKWIYTNKYRFYDVPNYLEVDYFTLSAFTIYDPFLITDFNPVNSREFRVSIYKNYNWKYIT